MSNDADVRLLASRLAALQQRVADLELRESAAFAWTAWTPTVTQSGSVTVTVTRARYCIVEKVCTVQIALAVTGSGTIANAIKIGGQPTAMQSSASGLVIGSALVTDDSVGQYVGVVYVFGATDWRFFVHNAASEVGIAPSFALANNDAIRLVCSYEVP